MKYTNSQDGVERCTVRLEMRFTKEQYKEIADVAKKSGFETVKKYLELSLLDGELLYNCLENDKSLIRQKEREEYEE